MTRRQRRRGMAPLEVLLVFPTIVLLLAAILWVARVGIVGTSALTEARGEDGPGPSPPGAPAFPPQGVEIAPHTAAAEQIARTGGPVSAVVGQVPGMAAARFINPAADPAVAPRH